MKRYLALCLACYFLLLLLPLPALGKLSAEKPPAPGISDPSAPSGPDVSDISVPPEEANFKVLDSVTGEVHTFSEKDFVFYTVAAEMYPTYHTEALKAQAVATYTYYSILRKQRRAEPDPALNGADFSNVPSTFPDSYSKEGLRERWGEKFDEYYAKFKGAIDAVFGQIVEYNGKPARTVYHAISFGVTEDASVLWGSSYPYLTSVASPGDTLAPRYQSTVTITKDDFAKKMTAAVEGLELTGKASSWIGKDISRSDAGTITAITIGNITMTGPTVRKALQLRSSNFTVSFADDTFTFTVLGYGHSVGLSQCGADYFANQGLTYEEILQYYYKGTTLSAI